MNHFYFQYFPSCNTNNETALLINTYTIHSESETLYRPLLVYTIQYWFTRHNNSLYSLHTPGKLIPFINTHACKKYSLQYTNGNVHTLAIIWLRVLLFFYLRIVCSTATVNLSRWLVVSVWFGGVRSWTKAE